MITFLINDQQRFPSPKIFCTFAVCMLPESPLRFTETEEQYRDWVEHGRTERPVERDLRPITGNVTTPTRNIVSPTQVPVSPPPLTPAGERK